MTSPNERTRSGDAAAVFERTTVGKDALVPELLRALDVLLRAPGDGPERSIALDLFAEAMGIKPRKLSARIARLQFFQLDGITLLEANRSTDRVTLHLDTLIMQYGLEP